MIFPDVDPVRVGITVFKKSPKRNQISLEEGLACSLTLASYVHVPNLLLAAHLSHFDTLQS